MRYVKDEVPPEEWDKLLRSKIIIPKIPKRPIVWDPYPNREHEVFRFVDGMKYWDVLYDIGACVGRFAVYAADRNRITYAFEPDPINFKALTDYKEPYLIPVNVALGDTEREVTLISKRHTPGPGQILSVAKRRDKIVPTGSVRIERVKMVSLDGWIAENRALIPTHIKIDIDGSEQLFVEGALRTLALPRLREIMIELYEPDPAYDDMIKVFRSFGFKITHRWPIGTEGLFNYAMRKAS